MHSYIHLSIPNILKHVTQVALTPQFSGGSENKIIWKISSILTQVEKFLWLFYNALKNDQD